MLVIPARSILFKPLAHTIHTTAFFRRSPPSFSKPGPPPLPAADQAEFEALLKANSAVGTVPTDENSIEEEMHKDVRRGPKPEFEGDVNPKTGERGGPKNDPFIAGESDWQFGGRVTDF
ncbi:uncharacterized protein L203_105475 [Cryptococcus depauperatus CBS 7841]|uniref:Succinate dehydrogenase assembly factor 4, mitochondrial n=1 Tax=Cryptococcus depauperatus CBS 7841 TaxID=1295531 RepID=A0A1E3IFC4_9TREE|nr:hypothetical protein L203_04153 [Cryptococcus depauperatus CBS 7841]